MGQSPHYFSSSPSSVSDTPTIHHDSTATQHRRSRPQRANVGGRVLINEDNWFTRRSYHQPQYNPGAAAVATEKNNTPQRFSNRGEKKNHHSNATHQNSWKTTSTRAEDEWEKALHAIQEQEIAERPQDIRRYQVYGVHTSRRKKKLIDLFVSPVDVYDGIDCYRWWSESGEECLCTCSLLYRAFPWPIHTNRRRWYWSVYIHAGWNQTRSDGTVVCVFDIYSSQRMRNHSCSPSLPVDWERWRSYVWYHDRWLRALGRCNDCAGGFIGVQFRGPTHMFSRKYSKSYAAVCVGVGKFSLTLTPVSGSRGLLSPSWWFWWVCSRVDWYQGKLIHLSSLRLTHIHNTHTTERCIQIWTRSATVRPGPYSSGSRVASGFWHGWNFSSQIHNVFFKGICTLAIHAFQKIHRRKMDTLQRLWRQLSWEFDKDKRLWSKTTPSCPISRLNHSLSYSKYWTWLDNKSFFSWSKLYHWLVFPV